METRSRVVCRVGRIGVALYTTSAVERDRLAELVSHLPPNLSADDQIVIVTTHDSARLDPARFGKAYRQTQLGDMLSQAVCISVNDPSFSELFELEDVEEASKV